MADWEKPEDYNFSLDLPPYLWAWEFLRRNPEYRKDWSRGLARFLKQEGEFAQPGPGQRPKRMVRPTWKVYEEPWANDPQSPDFFLPAAERKKWRLGWGLLNPETDNPTNLAFSPPLPRLIFLEEEDAVEGKGLNFPCAFFDLRNAIEPQLAALRPQLEDAQAENETKPKGVKRRKEMWPHYLRLLDAVLDRRTPTQIADFLTEHEFKDGFSNQKVFDQLKAAKRLSEPRGYLSIAMDA